MLVRIICLLWSLCPAPTLAADTSQASTISFRQLHGVDPLASIDAVCCADANQTRPYALGPPRQSIRAMPSGPPMWLRIDMPLAGTLLVIRPIVDRAELYWRDAHTGRWQSSITGDHVPSGERSLRVPDMALPVAADAGAGPFYLRIEQVSFVSIRLQQHQTEVFLVQQRRYEVLKLLLLGFISAIVAYNLFVSALIRDPVFLFNALTILSLLTVAAYLTGYGAIYLWSSQPHWGEQVMNGAVTTANIAGPLFIRDYLLLGGRQIGRLRLMLAPAPLALGGFILGLVGPYELGRHALLLVSALTMLILAYVLLRGAWRGHRQARLICIPFLLSMAPGLTIAALQRLGNLETGLLSDNTLGIFLALEALLFSLVIATRVRIAESALSAAGLALQDARRQASARILRAQDAERQRVAQDLHDSVGQGLLFLINTIKLAISKARRSGSVPLESLDRALADSTQVLDSLRRISRTMHPAMLEHLGWQGAVESLVDEVRRGTDIDCTASFELAEELPRGELRLHLYRMVQESLNNVMRHAQATRCVARFESEKTQFRIAVDDDGIGPLDPAGHPRSIGLGLTSIDERVRMLGGQWHLGDSELGGARLEITVPINIPASGSPNHVLGSEPNA